MKLLLTGAGGMLGTALQNTFADYDIIATDHHGLDITDTAAIDATITSVQPAIIINAAAYTAVDAAETDVDRAYAVNRDGAAHLAAAARMHDALLIHFSTDYVFDGENAAGYAENDEPHHPVNVYGKSKLAGEEAIRTSNCRYVIIRTSWLFGPHGKNFVDTMRRLGRERSELNVVADQHGCPTLTLDLAAATRAIVEEGQTGMFHLTNSEPTTWADFAREIFQLENLPTIVRDITSADYPTPARRPPHSILLNTRRPPLRSWRDALADYLAQTR